MSILRLSTFSLTLAIAVMTLGYNPSFANKPDPVTGHDHGGEDETETVFMVKMVQGDLLNDPMTGDPPEGLVITDPTKGSPVIGSFRQTAHI